jgi:DNA-binding CsgD family transcriptional regulator
MLDTVNDSHFEVLFRRLRGAPDITSFWGTVRSILDETLPQRAEPTARGKQLLRQLHLHVETTVQQVAEREVRSAALSRKSKAARPLAESVLHQLSPAERDIALLVLEGWSNKEIARELGKSIRTVKTQLTSVYKKLSVRSRSRLLAMLS